MSVAAGTQKKSTVPGEFFPISLCDLRIGTVVGFDLYLPPTPGDAPVLYRHRDLDFSDDARLRLIENRVDCLYVPVSQESSYHAYMESNIRTALTDPRLTHDEKAQILYSTSCHMIREFLGDPKTEDMIPRTRDMVGAAVDHLLAEQESFASFLRSASLDYRTYTHSVDVAMYMLHFSQAVGKNDAETLQEIGVGTFLHDIGKYCIPEHILNKPGKLSAQEWRIMRKHPQWGVEILEAHGVTGPVVIAITRDHHEKLDGSGYPNGVHADSLPDYVRMTTICDIFDALTTQRAYRERLNSYSALDIMKKEMSKQLDPDFFAAFVLMLHVDL